MKITVAKTAGFCMGVRRAVDMVLDAANRTGGPICTFGPLIHNPQVQEMLQEKGIPSIKDIPEKGEGTILIRAHGVPPRDKTALEAAGFKVIDATCPRVIRVQTIIGRHHDKGYNAIIIGDADHPEVRGLLGYAGEKGFTAASLKEVKTLPAFDKAVVVAQTTQDTSLFQEIKHWIAENHPHYKIHDTICHSTEKRQAETREIAEKSDAVIVVGGKHSGNTQRLAQIAQATGKPSMHIEDISEIDYQLIDPADTIAITAGASTPNWIINKTCRAIEEHIRAGQKKNRVFFQVRNLLLKTNVLLAAGAGCLTLACAYLQELDHVLIHAVVAGLYVLSMQILNNLLTISSDRYNHPERAQFYETHKSQMTTVALVSGGAGLILSFSHSTMAFMILMTMSFLGLTYNLDIFSFLPGVSRFKALKDIPGSKTLLIAAAWGTVTSILPAMESFTFSAVAVSFVFATGLVFARTAFFNVLEMQGDRITGKETLPLILGEEKSLALIKTVLTSVTVMLLIATTLGITGSIGFLLAIIPTLLLNLIVRCENGYLLPGSNLEFIVDAHFLLAGMAVFW
ncbi:4-hydroxy-3-methylbut-2-enyl diphosphate reductase [Desulfocicer niacini]